MDLYATVVILSGGSSHRICITDKYYEYLINKNTPYRTKINNELVEIPVNHFIKDYKVKLTPVMLKHDGTVDYELDPNDYTKKKDGTPSDINNTTYQGNAMMQYQKRKKD